MKILVAYDGSKHAQAAIRDLRRSGIPREFTALVTTVGDLPASGVGSPSLDPTIARRAGVLLFNTRTRVRALARVRAFRRGRCSIDP